MSQKTARKTKKSNDEASPEDPLMLAIETIFTKFMEQEDTLDQIPEKANLAVNALNTLFASKVDFFKEPQELYTAISGLSEVQGYVQHTVLEIELQRERIRKPAEFVEGLVAQRRRPEPAVPPQLIVQTAQPVSSGTTFWGLLAERSRNRVLEQELRLRENGPTLTTPQRVRDILDYGRDIASEYNKLIDYFRSCIAMTTIYPDDALTRDFFFEEIRCYVTKLGNIIKSFSRAIAEYRKELNSERAEAYARALTMVKQAEYMGLGGMTQSDLYTLLRENTEAENVSQTRN